MKLVIKGGRVINPGKNMDSVCDILIENGKIAAMGAGLPVDGCQVYDAAGLIVTPGLIDMHVHLREPGLEAKEDIVSGTQAAAAGGFTTIACMPNTKPVVDSAVLVAGIQQRAAAEGIVNVKVIGALSKGQEGKELSEIGDMIGRGAAAISDDGTYVSSAGLMKTALEYTGMFDRVIISHAEDESLVSDGYMHEGAVSAVLGMRGRPAVAEEIIVARDIMLAEYTGSPVHIAHMSAKGAVELVRQAKKRGVPVTAEVTPHHLSLTDEVVRTFNTATKVNPPLRSEEHRQALIAGLQDGTIDAIATDHAPHAFEEKDREYRYAPSGFTGMETAVGVTLTALYHTGSLNLMDIIARLTVNPARILRLEAGVLDIGREADIAVIDPDLVWTVDSSAFYTRGKMTPFEGRELRGKTVATLVKGNFVMRNGEILA